MRKEERHEEEEARGGHLENEENGDMRPERIEAEDGGKVGKDGKQAERWEGEPEGLTL